MPLDKFTPTDYVGVFEKIQPITTVFGDVFFKNINAKRAPSGSDKADTKV